MEYEVWSIWCLEFIRHTSYLLRNATAEEKADWPGFGADAERLQESARYGDGGQHRDDNAESEKECEASDERRAKPKENDGGDDRGNIGVADRRPRSAKSVRHSLLDALAALELLACALEDKNVGINRHTDREDERSDAGCRERYRNEHKKREHDGDVHKERDRSERSGKAIPKNHKKYHGENADETGHNALRDGLPAERRRYRLRLDELYGYRQRAVVEITRELFCTLRREIAGDDGSTIGNRILNDRRRDHGAIEKDRHGVADIILGDIGENFGAFRIKFQNDNRLIQTGLPLKLQLRTFQMLASNRGRLEVLIERRSGNVRWNSLNACLHEAKLQYRCLSNKADCLLRVGHARQLHQKTLLRGPRHAAALLGFHQWFGDTKRIDAPLDGVAQRCHRIRHIGARNIRDIGAIDELGSAGEIESELEGQNRLCLGYVHKVPYSDADKEHDKSRHAFLQHWQQYTQAAGLVNNGVRSAF